MLLRDFGYSRPAQFELDVTHPLSIGLVHCMPFGDGLGVSRDVSLYQRNGIPTLNGGTIAEAWDGGGRAISLSGAAFVTAAAPTDADFIGALTIAVFIRLTNLSNFRAVCCKQGASASATFPFEFRVDSTTGFLNVTRANGGGFKQFTGPALSLGVLYRIGVTFADGSLATVPTFYVNGVPTVGSAAAGSGSGAVTGGGDNIRWGTRPGNATTTDHTLRLGKIYNRALNLFEMQCDYAESYGGLMPSRMIFPAASAGAQTLSPSLLSDSDAFWAPIITKRNTVSPGLFSDTDTFFAPTVTARKTISAPLFSDSDTIFAPVVTGGSVTIQPPLVTDSDAFFGPTVTKAIQYVQPGLLSESDSFYAPTVHATKTLAPGLLSDADTFYAPTLTRGVATIRPPLVVDNDLIYRPTVYDPASGVPRTARIKPMMENIGRLMN